MQQQRNRNLPNGAGNKRLGRRAVGYSIISLKERDLEKENRDWIARQRELSLASHGLREQELHRIAAQYELESDEFYTWREKAERARVVEQRLAGKVML